MTENKQNKIQQINNNKQHSQECLATLPRDAISVTQHKPQSARVVVLTTKLRNPSAALCKGCREQTLRSYKKPNKIGVVMSMDPPSHQGCTVKHQKWWKCKHERTKASRSYISRKCILFLLLIHNYTL